MKKVLFIGAHGDDIELGCGATIHKHRQDWEMRAWVFSESNLRGDSLVGTVRQSLARLGILEVGFSGFSTGYFEEHRQLVWEKCAELEADFAPDLVFVNSDGDTHQDHRTICSEALRKTFRGSVVVYDPVESQHCDICETVSEADVQAKLEALSFYRMYASKPYFEPDYVKARMRAASISTRFRYAETFCVRRLINGL